MSDFCDDFEKRFTSSWFSAGWVEVQPLQKTKSVSAREGLIDTVSESHRKSLEDLQEELSALKTDVEKISFKQLRLENLAKFY